MKSMKPCDWCGKENPDDYNFCMKCGKPFILATTATGVAVSPTASHFPAFTVEPHSGTKPTRIGSREYGNAVRSNPFLTRCPFCAEEVLADAKKCKHCGEFIDLSRLSNAAFSGGLKELSLYYQKEFQRITDSAEVYRGRWNWAAFFFGGFWAISKGLWASGFVSIVGSILTAGIAGVIYWFIFGARGNYMYYKKIVKRQEPWI